MTQLVQVQYAKGGRAYTYSAPDDIKVGNVVLVPTNAGGMLKGTVVELGSTYNGPTLAVLEVVE